MTESQAWNEHREPTALTDEAGRWLCEAACRVGAEVIVAAVDPQVWQKAPNDVVTEVDLASQRAIREFLANEAPQAAFVGEEGTASDLAPMAGPLCFVVDPIDGTANFARGIPFYAVSVGMMRDGRLAAGAVLDVVRGEMFSAHAGGGATVDGQAMSVVPCERLVDAVVGLSFPTALTDDDDVVRSVARLLPRVPNMRRFGSAALTLCYLAAGRVDGYFSSHVKPWDVAAGVLIAWEAGAIVTSLSGDEFDPRAADFVAASTEVLRAELGRWVVRDPQPAGATVPAASATGTTSSRAVNRESVLEKPCGAAGSSPAEGAPTGSEANPSARPPMRW